MFRKLIIGYIYSSSMGETLLKYEKDLRKQIRWGIFCCASIVFSIFIIILPILITPPRDVSEPLFKEDFPSLSLYSRFDNTEDKIKPGQKVSLKLFATNTGDKVQDFNFKFQSSDILEYTTIDNSDIATIGNYSYFPTESIRPNETKEKDVFLTIKSILPSFRHSPKNSNSYNCQLDILFGNYAKQKIPCPLDKRVAKLQDLIPSLDVKITTLTLCMLLIISVIITIRTNLLLKEIRLIRQGGGFSGR